MKKNYDSGHFLCARQKILLAMKMTAILILGVFMQVSAAVYSQNTRLNINMQDVSLKTIFQEIKKQSGYSFIYNEKAISKLDKMNLNIKNGELKSVLDYCLSNTTLGYDINKNVIVIISKSLDKKDKKAKSIVVKGTVKDEKGNSLPGVSVVVKGTSLGVSTNVKGEYSIEFPKSDKTVLVFSFIGMETQEIKVGKENKIDVTLKEKASSLDEVVVTGIFERKASSYTGSTVTVTQEQLKKVGNSNLFQALKNLDPSMVVLDNFEMGSNPNAMPDIHIRGTSTLQGNGSDLNLKGNYQKSPNQPLFILDGFEASVEKIFDLDMDRVRSVTILKDAAAKAIYGSKAANGVVVVETKKLLANETRVTYRANLDVQMPDLTSYDLTNSLEKLEAERIDGMYIPSRNDAEEYIRLQQLYNYRKKLALEGLDTDWMSKPLQTGIGQKHSISVEMGTQELKMLADFSYKKSEGVMIGSSRENISGTMLTSYRLKNIRFRNSMSVNSNKSENSIYGTFYDYAKMNPYWRAVNTDGSIPFYAEIGSNGERYTNPLYNSTLNSKDESSYFSFTDNFYIEWTMTPGLKATARMGVEVKNSDADEFYPSGHTKFYNYYSVESKKRKGSYQVNNGKFNRLSGDLNINYSKEIGKSFFFSNLGFNISNSEYKETIHKVEGFPSQRMDNITFGRDYALNSRPTGVESISRSIGFLGVFSYMYDNRFLSDLTLRSNASSLFGADKRWAKFWSLGLGWNLHNEEFLKDSEFLKELKLRGSIGTSGNQNFNTNASISKYNYYLDSQYQGFVGSYLQNMANSDLQWESKFDYNIGFDMRYDKLTLKFDYYETYTKNNITDITLPSSTGFEMFKENLGEVKNSGFEVSTSYSLWSNKKSYMNIFFSVATNKNKIIELSDAMKSFNDAMDAQAADKSNNTPIHKYEDGKSNTAIWAVPSQGIDPSTGQEIYIDRNGNTTYEWNSEDMVVCGDKEPEFRGTFGIDTEFKGFGLSVTCRYLGGGQLYNSTLVNKVENVDMNYNVDKRVLTGRWTRPGQNAKFKKLGYYSKDTDGDNAYEQYKEVTRLTSRFVQDRNEIDIASISLSYTFNKALIKNLGMERLKLFFNMNDVYKFSSIKIERGTSFPFARTMSFSLLATF